MFCSADLEHPTRTQVRCWLTQAQRGHADGRAFFAALVPLVHAQVARALWRRRGQAKGRRLGQELDDLVQETFLHLLADQGRALLAWDPARGASFLGFVGLLAERQVGMLLRNARRSPFTEDPTDPELLAPLVGPEPSEERRHLVRDLGRRLLSTLFAELGPKGRRYFELLWLDEQPIPQVVAQTGASPVAIYAFRSRTARRARALAAAL